MPAMPLRITLVVQPMLTIPPIPMYLREYLLLEIATSHEQLAYSDTQHRWWEGEWMRSCNEYNRAGGLTVQATSSIIT